MKKRRYGQVGIGRKTKLFTSIVLLVALLMYEGVSGVLTIKAQNINSAEVYSTAEQIVELNLNKRKDTDNVAFQVSNMFPGDMVSGDYCIKVSYEDAVTVKFRVDIGEGYEKLAEVLKCRIALPNTDKVLYEGLMKEVPEALEQALPYAEKGEAELDYQITAYLDTSVGNEYQGTKLEADFVWWIEVEEQTDSDTDEETTTPGSNDKDENGDITGPEEDEKKTDTVTPETGDDTNMVTWLVLAVCTAVIFLVLIIAMKRKEDRRHEQ